MGELIQKPLQRTRNRQTWLESISSQSEGTRKNKRSALIDFDKFCNHTFHTKDCEPIIEELQKTKSIEQAVDVLQDWINWSIGKKKPRQPNGLRNYFVNINEYLYYRGIKLDRRDTRTLKFPKLIKRKGYPLTLEEIQQIITPVSHKKKSMYLALISSGMRIEECLRVQKKHIDLSLDRIKITIPGEFTKTGEERITFLSKEAEKFNIKHIRSLDDDDLVWGQNSNWRYNVSTEDQNFGRYVENAKLGMKYPSGVRKITLHSFRSYFITKGNKVDDIGFGHALAGHGYYMKSYDRYPEEELLELYKKLEPELFIFDLTKKNQRITELEQANTEIESLKVEKEKVRDYIKEQLKEFEEKYGIKK